jgi:hypothetical protein
MIIVLYYLSLGRLNARKLNYFFEKYDKTVHNNTCL